MKRFKIYAFAMMLYATTSAYSAQPINADDYYPDDNMTIAFEFNITDPGDSNSSFVIAYPDENNSVVFYSLPASDDLERNDTVTGKVSYNRRYNMSNPSDLDKWLQERAGSFHKKANEIVAKVNKKTGFADKTDSEKGIAALATDYIYEHSDQNSTRRRVIDSVKDIQDKLFAKISNRKHIKCYVSRSLKPGYMCPLPTLENSFVLGYAQKDSKTDAIEECNSRCRIEKSCISREMPFAATKKIAPGLNIFENSEYVADANDRQTIRKVSFKVEISDLNATKLKKRLYHFRYGVDYYYAEAWHTLYENYKIDVADENTTISFYVDRSASKIKVHFYRPYESDPLDFNRDILLLADEHKFLLNDFEIDYSGTAHWFCPNTQYVFPDEDPNVACKDGTIKDAPTGSSVNQVCVPDALPPYRDEEYGAYKSQFMCESECFVKEECVPTYRQPGQLDYNGYVPSNKYDIEIDCMDAPDNQACTQELCQKLFMEDARPILERIWTNNDDVITTVKDGSRVPGVQRPKIDIAGELSSNGGDKDEVFKEEMKDSAYVSMLKNGTYNVSSQSISQEYASQLGYEFKMDKTTGRKSLTMLLKADSFQYDDGKEYYFYPIVAVDIIYHPIGGIIVGQNYIYGESDPNIRALDRLVLVKTESSWKIIRRIEAFRMYVKNSEGDYVWVDTSASATVSSVTFADGAFKAYSASDTLLPSWRQQLSSDEPFERFLVSLDMDYTFNQTPGVLFVNQTNVSASVKKIYSADGSDIDESKRAFLYSYNAYGVYYDHPAKISELLSNYPTKQFFSSLQQKKFPSEIPSETLYSDDHVKLFVHGVPSRISVNAKFAPASAEEGKKTFFFIFAYDPEEK